MPLFLESFVDPSPMDVWLKYSLASRVIIHVLADVINRVVVDYPVQFREVAA